MAIVNLNRCFQSMSGRLGDVVFRTVNGRTYMSRHPRASDNAPTKRQREQQVRFREAAAYARRVTADSGMRARYVPFVKNPSAFYAAVVRDYLRPPVIEAVDLDAYHGQNGDLIRVVATDDTCVSGVTVTLRNRDGELVEHGSATSVNGDWEYRVTQTVPGSRVVTVEVTAEDLAGNRAVATRMVGTP